MCWRFVFYAFKYPERKSNDNSTLLIALKHKQATVLVYKSANNSVHERADVVRKERQEKALAVEGQKYLESNAQKEGCQHNRIWLAVPRSYSGSRLLFRHLSTSVANQHRIPVNGVIAGWIEALTLMPVGSKWELSIPHNLAYGERGAGASIPPFSALIFEVELLEIL
ncbi:unnamed protein product [Ranitomeya imitator]|uniref:peptidylprolyl isomerase n=1 Tax=Ranitomeya imitator TaxID=111125 RepID=A0ABN9LJ66_9NEOB|nr:unnamed protein product [Ranitomeya imitator]